MSLLCRREIYRFRLPSAISFGESLKDFKFLMFHSNGLKTSVERSFGGDEEKKEKKRRNENEIKLCTMKFRRKVSLIEDCYRFLFACFGASDERPPKRKNKQFKLQLDTSV